MKIGFIGLGKLGLPCAEVMACMGNKVKGYDLIYKHSESLDVVDSIYDAVDNQDIIFIAVPTPHDKEYGGELPVAHLEPKPFDYSIIKEVLLSIRDRVNSNQIICLISTVLPGTIRSEFLPLIKHPRQFVYNPYLIAMGTVKQDFLNPDMVILGGFDAKNDITIQNMAYFYRGMLPDAPLMLGTWEEAESYKLFYNTFISMKLSFVNMIQDVAQELGHMNVDTVTEALTRSTMRITSKAYMKAGMGDGGACHPRDNIALRYLAKRFRLGYDLFSAIAESREKQAERLALFLVRQGNKDIVIVGKSYKPNINLTEGSYSLLVGHYIEQYGAKVHYHDEDTNDIFSLSEYPTITVLVGHWSRYTEDFLKNLHWSSTIVDPWRRMTRTELDGVNYRPRVIHYGNSR